MYLQHYHETVSLLQISTLINLIHSLQTYNNGYFEEIPHKRTFSVSVHVWIWNVDSLFVVEGLLRFVHVIFFMKGS